MNRLIHLLILACFLAGKAYAWNSLGHRLVGQIAYNHLSYEAKQRYDRYNHALDKVYRPQSLVNSAAWLDSLRYQNQLWLQERHYINLPFSFDGTKLKPPKKINAVVAIKEAHLSLQSQQTSDFDKGFNLRILFHVVGDLHQPLHAVSQFSAAHPNGDMGGNLFPLKANSIAHNLHAYWDRGGGAFITKGKRVSNSLLRKKARAIERNWPCSPKKMSIDPSQWAEESKKIAMSTAYRLKPGQKPDKNYQLHVMHFSEQRIALAGCRLAALLNSQ